MSPACHLPALRFRVGELHTQGSSSIHDALKAIAMTDRLSAPTTRAARVRRARPAGLALLGAGCLFLAVNSAYCWGPPDYDHVIVPGYDEPCSVWNTLFSGTTTKAGHYPAGTSFRGLIVDCKGSQGRTIAVLEARKSGLPTEIIPPIVKTKRDLAFAVDPFTVGVYESDGSPLNPYHAFRYNLDTSEFQDLGTFTGPAGTSVASGVNIDGSVVVGASDIPTVDYPTWQAFRWTPALGMKNLGALVPNGFSHARATSQDGTVVVGSTDVPGAKPGDYNETHAFRWVLTNPATGAGAFTDLGPATLEALAVNGDGSVIVGNLKSNRASRWTQAGGVVDLGALPGHTRSMATAVSADGTVVVGISSSNFITSSFAGPGPSFDKKTSRAFRWTQATGMVDLNPLAAAAGYDMTGITLVGALGLSMDGQTISGAGFRDGADDTSGFSIEYAATNVGGPAPPVSVIEFYNASLDHYFIAYAADEIAKLDNGTFKDWARTGLSFNAYVTPQGGASAVCRIYIPPGKGDGHFFGRDNNECNGTMTKNPSFVLESSTFLYLFPPNLGTCAAGTVPVYRVYSNRADANHRYTTDRAVRDQMVTKGWLAEGDGADIVVMCAPQ